MTPREKYLIRLMEGMPELPVSQLAAMELFDKNEVECQLYFTEDQFEESAVLELKLALWHYIVDYGYTGNDVKGCELARVLILHLTDRLANHKFSKDRKDEEYENSIRK